MIEHKGKLIEVGPSKTVAGWVKYSYLRIDNQLLKNVHSTPGMQTILRGQVGQEGVTLHIGKAVTSKTIFAITQSDGQTFRASATRQFMTPLALLIPALVPTYLLAFFSTTAMVIWIIFMLSMFAYSWRLAFKIVSIPADHVF